VDPVFKALAIRLGAASSSSSTATTVSRSSVVSGGQFAYTGVRVADALANLLLPLLALGTGRTEVGRLVRFVEMLGADVVRAEEAEPGTIGLLRYSRDAWDEFDGGAKDLNGPPDVRVALAGFPERLNHGGGVIVAPEVLSDVPLLALWRVTGDGTLDVVATRHDPPPSAQSPIEALRAVRDLRRRRFQNVGAGDGCTRLQSPLSCVVAGCPHVCMARRWFDKRLKRPKYACVCTRPRVVEGR
jgi:hypothetical protein